MVLLQDPLDAGSALRLLGAKLAHEDQLKAPETEVGTEKGGTENGDAAKWPFVIPGDFQTAVARG